MADQIGAERGRPPEQWGSSLGFVLAAAGSAVGLGNLWGFAYRASQGGGAAFVLLYVLIVAVVCLPVLVAEMVLGRSTGHAPLVAPITAGGRRWAPLGWLYIAASVGILSYYAVLMGWTGRSLLHALTSPLPADMAAAESFFAGISSGGDAVLGHLLSLALTSSVSLLEVPVSSLMDRLGWSRPRAVWLMVAVIAVIGLPSALDVAVLEKMDAVFGGVCLIAGGLLMALLMGWRAPERFSSDLRGSGTSPRLLRLLLWGLRWVSVPVISLGLIVSVVDLAKSWSGGA